MSASQDQIKNDLLEEVGKALREDRHVDPSVARATSRLLAEVGALCESGKGVRRSTVLKRARNLVLPAFFDAVQCCPSIAADVPSHAIEHALDGPSNTSVLIDTVDEAIGDWWAAVAEKSAAPGFLAGADPNRLLILQHTTDLLEAISFCIQQWPKSTTEVRGARSREAHRANYLCFLCHRPTERYEREHGFARPSYGKVISSGYSNSLDAYQRGSAQLCSDHSKRGEQNSNAARYAVALRRAGTYDRGKVRTALRESGLSVPHSARLLALVDWTSAYPTLGKKVLARLSDSYAGAAARRKNLVESILAGLPGLPFVPLTNDLLEISLTPDGLITTTHLAAEPPPGFVPPDSWSEGLANRLLQIGRENKLLGSRNFEHAVIEDLGIELIRLNSTTLRIVFQSPTWLKYAVAAIRMAKKEKSYFSRHLNRGDAGSLGSTSIQEQTRGDSVLKAK